MVVGGGRGAISAEVDSLTRYQGGNRTKAEASGLPVSINTALPHSWRGLLAAAATLCPSIM